MYHTEMPAAVPKMQPTGGARKSTIPKPQPEQTSNFLKEQGYCKEFHYQTPSAKEFCSIFNVCTQCIHFSLTCITAAIKKIVAVCSNWPSGFYITLKISSRTTQKGEQDSVQGEGTAGATLLIFKCLKRRQHFTNSKLKASKQKTKYTELQGCL